MKTNQYDEIETWHDGDTIFREGDPGREMRIIQRGAVVVSKRVGNKEITLAVLERGNFFGEMGLLESLPCGATVRAKGETRLLVIRAGSLLLKIRRDPTFAFEMLQQMSRRIRSLNDRLVASLAREQPHETSTNAALASAGAEFDTPAPNGDAR